MYERTCSHYLLIHSFLKWGKYAIREYSREYGLVKTILVIGRYLQYRIRLRAEIQFGICFNVLSLRVSHRLVFSILSYMKSI